MKHKKTGPVFAALAALWLLTGCGSSGASSAADALASSPAAAAASAPAEGQAQFSFSDVLNLEFWFGSGAGAWRTVLTIREDGAFEGEYSDSEMGAAGEDYPNGTQYQSRFTGVFTEPERVNDYTYSMEIAHIQLEEEPDTEEIKDGVKYIYSLPYGLDGAEEILIYLPGAPVEELPEEYKSWMMGYSAFTDTQLPFYGLFNVTEGNGFSSYEKTETQDAG